MTVSSQIIAHIAARLALIRAGSQISRYRSASYTFKTSAGERVCLNSEIGEYSEELPVVALFPGTIASSLEGAELGMQISTLGFTIGGEIESDKAGTEGNDLLTDITATIKADPWFGGLIDEIHDWTGEVSVQVGERVSAIVKITFTVTYTVPYGSE